ncbi:MAG: restriction endonuclease subunit S [Akkermansiaceae bacterium]|nr:restriction endonuclease subunit S [Akkermansiaceae bacterium]
MKCVEAESGRFCPARNKKVGEVKKGYTPMRDGDVTFAKVTPCMENVKGRCSSWSHQRNRILVLLSSTRFARKDNLMSEFLFYYIIQQGFRREAERHMTGAVGLQRVPKVFIEEHDIPLPPLPEQRRIVARIEELFSRLDAGVAALRHARAQLQRYRQSVLAAAVTGELTREWREQNAAEASRLSSSDKDQRQDASATLLTEPADALLERILKLRREMWDGRGKYKEPVEPNDAFDRSPPSNWQIASMDALTCHITSGSRDWTKYYTDDGYAVFVMAQNVRPLKFHSTPVVRVAPPDGDRDKARSKVAENDLLITIVGANTGDVCRVDKGFDDYYVCQSVALLRPVESATANYLELYMNSEEHGQDLRPRSGCMAKEGRI